MTDFKQLQAKWVKLQNWPPYEVKDEWAKVKTLRRYYESDRQEMLIANPNLSVSPHRVEIFVPVPWAREICRFSSSLLFPQAPRVLYKDEEAVHELVRANDLGSFVIEGGVLAAVEGRIGIRILRDPAVSDLPLLTLVQGDQIIWHRRHKRFTIGGVVVIERTQQENQRESVYRLLENHTPGLVERVLYLGEVGRIGNPVPFDRLPEFAHLEAVEHTGLSTATLLPWDNVPGGESDLMALRSLLDTYNEGESLLLDRARKAIPRVFVDRSLADDTGRLTIDGYILTGGSRMRTPLGTTAGTLVNVVEPAFAAKEHIEWMDHLAQLLVTVAGYAPSTWGIQGHTANVSRVVSGYALKLTQMRTLLNRSAKEHMALQALGWAIAVALAWQSGSLDTKAFLPTIELGDGLPSDALDGAQEILFLKQAQAASAETLVRTIHPLWSPEEVKSEVELIQNEIAFTAQQTANGKAGIGPTPFNAGDIWAYKPASPAGSGSNAGAATVDGV